MSNKQTIHLITRSSRLENLDKLADSIYPCDLFNINWHIIFDTNRVQDIDSKLLSKLTNEYDAELYYRENIGDYLHTSMSDVIKSIETGWIYILDDDNIIHEDFYKTIHNELDDSKVYVFNQFVDGKDFTGKDYRYAKPENMVVGKVDSGQFIFHRDVFTFDIPSVYTGDGQLIEKLYDKYKADFKFIDKVISHYNYLQDDSKHFLPRILYIGDGTPDLKTKKVAEWFEAELDVTYINPSDNINEYLYKVNPDCILTDVEDPLSLDQLMNKPNEIRRKWYNVWNEDDNDKGQIGYNVAMNYMLSDRDVTLVSYFTPVHNIGTDIYNTYNSLVSQTYDNWEWVIVNDSTDGRVTLNELRELERRDCRVKVYDFRDKTGGIVGEAKYRASTLTRGEILAELDHDDYLIKTCTEDLVKAYEEHPACGFYYGDSAEIGQDGNSLKYDEGFSFGYGKYYEGEFANSIIDVADETNINPKTIRHIVGVPNHIRAWRRDVYFSIGGHNRHLTIADDYELIVRTFLETKFCKIPRLTYLQFIHDNNTHESSRADIQRRVDSIAFHYNEKIKKRFEELGKTDWAYEYDSSKPLNCPSKFGEEEGYVNEILNLD